MKDLIVLKLGGSIITHKSSQSPSPDHENLKRLADEIAEAQIKPIRTPASPQLVIVHGGGSYAHRIVKTSGINLGITNEAQLLSFSQAQMEMSQLNLIVTDYLVRSGLPAIPYQASSSVVMSGGRIHTFAIESISGMISTGMIPILYGVPAYDKVQKCSILSGDQIAPYLAGKLYATRIIEATDQKGVFTSDPKKDSAAKLIPFITGENFEQIKESLGGSLNVDVTGGMLGKVMELKQAELKIQCDIIDGREPGYVKRALLGECGLGTSILF